MKPGTYGRHILTESSGMDDLVVAKHGRPSYHQQSTCHACRSLARGSRLSKQLLPEQPARHDRRNSKQHA